MPIGNGSENLMLYYVTLTQKYPWASGFFWYERTDIYLRPSIIFCGNDSTAEESSDNLMRKEFSIKPIISNYHTKQFDLSETMRNIRDKKNYDAIIRYDGKIVAVIVRNLKTILLSKITHVYNLFGIYVLDSVFSIAEKIMPEIKELKPLPMFCYAEIDYNNEKIKFYDASRVSLDDRFLDEFMTPLNSLIYSYSQRLKTHINNIIDRIIRFQEAEFDYETFTRLVQKNYPVMIIDRNIYVVIYAPFQPKYVKKGPEVKILPCSLRRKIARKTYLAFRIQKQNNGIYVDKIKMLTKKLSYLDETLPHYDGNVCYGNVATKMSYDSVPSFEEFCEKTAKPIIESMNMINLDSAFNCDMKYMLLDEFEKLPNADYLWSVSDSSEEEETEEDYDEDYDDYYDEQSESEPEEPEVWEA